MVYSTSNSHISPLPSETSPEIVLNPLPSVATWILWFNATSGALPAEPVMPETIRANSCEPPGKQSVHDDGDFESARLRRFAHDNLFDVVDVIVA